MDQLSTLAGILQRAYKGPLHALMNDETNAYNLMAKGPWKWEGESLQIPWHVAHDSVDAAWLAEAGALVDPGTGEVTRQLTVPARNVTKKILISGTALDQAKGNTFIPGLQLSMKGAAAQVLNRIDRAVFSGGEILGYFQEHKVVAAGNSTWDFSGDANLLNACITAVNQAAPAGAGVGALVAIKLLRTDTLAVASPAADNDTTLVSVNETGGQVVIESQAGFTTAALPAGVSLAVRVTGTVPALGGVFSAYTAAAAGTALQAIVQHSPTGFYGGFSQSVYHGVTRASATMGSTNAIGTVVSCSTAGAHDRIQLTADRLAGVFVEHLRRASDSGAKINLVLVEPGFLQEYAGLVTQTTNMQRDVSKPASGWDAGLKLDEGKIYGVPLRSFQRCGRGMALFINQESWKMAECRKPDWSKYSGSILRQGISSGATIDGAEGNFLWRGNFVNLAPNTSVALVGIDFAGAA